MPDKWGRTTFNDGLQIAKTVEYFKHEKERLDDRAANKDAYNVADTMAAGGDTSGFSPESRYKGASLYWDNKFDEVRTKTREQLHSNAATREKILKLKLNLDQAGEKLRVYKSARAAGNDKLAKQLAIQISNEHMYNGRYIEEGKEGYDVTSFDGTKESIKDIPIEEVDQLLGAYFDKPQDEIMKWQMGAEQMRSQRNEEIISQAEPWVNEKGQIIYKIPSGTWGPDGKPRGSFYVDGPEAQTELSPEQVKGFTKFDVADKKVGLAQKKKDLNRPDIVNPSSVVRQDGQAGLITADDGEIGFEPVKGGLDVVSSGEGGTASSRSTEFNTQVKRLNTELMPFLDKGSSAIDPETLAITNDGRNALMNALKLVQKQKDNPESLSESEKAIAQNAARAVEIYQTISEGNRQAFGLEKAPQKPEPTKPPAGFILD